MDLDALIQRAKANDQSAFDVIYRTYHPKMVRICTNIVKEDREAVEDLVHDAFVMAFVSLGSLKDNSKFNEWLTSIVRNVALKHIEQRVWVQIKRLSD
jgi:RNA polymerase sigma-70 factor (ECF subfamily)